MILTKAINASDIKSELQTLYLGVSAKKYSIVSVNCSSVAKPHPKGMNKITKKLGPFQYICHTPQLIAINF